MREILFRGKSAQGDWIFGNIQVPKPPFERWYMWSEKGFQKEVIPETVGQFTGLTDKNGVKIFENDIFLVNGKAYFVQFLGERGSYVLTTGNGFDSRNCMGFNCDIVFELEVIGNITDNKNLLEQNNE